MSQAALKKRSKTVTPNRATPAARRVAAARHEAQQQADQQRHHALVKQYLPFATSVANRVAKTLAPSADYDDILCNARLGLFEAAQRFDDREGVDFRTFAYYRIKGAIYDGLRKSGWLPRSLYARLKFEEAANDYLEYCSHRHSPETAAPGGEEAAISETVNGLASIYVISLDAHEDLDVIDENQVSVEERATLHQVRAHMRTAMSQLPSKEKQLIMMYYFQNRTLEEAGARLGLSKSWTSRLHARALTLLMKQIRRLANDHHVEGTPIGDEIEAEW